MRSELRKSSHLQRGTYAKASLLKARNTVKEAKKPVFRPIVWQVEA
jgi:hypothetical protein